MLTAKHVKTIDVPGEEGQWVKVRMPSLSIIQDSQRQAPADERDAEIRASYAVIPLLQRCVLEWSYDEPVTPENVADLDPSTAAALVTALMEQPDRKNS